MVVRGSTERICNSINNEKKSEKKKNRNTEGKKGAKLVYLI